MSAEDLTLPVDETSRAALDQRGLRMGLVDPADRASTGNWIRAEARGFYDEHMGDETVDAVLSSLGDRRMTGVWDETIAEPELPVATVDAWRTPLTLPGRRTADAWAISGVSVAPTHRRRGVARALLEAELRTAQRLGIPIAILTVSESTLYGRYGFSPAALAADWTFDTRRVSWAGRQPGGRIHFLAREAMRAQAPAIHEQFRLESPGEIRIDGWRWDGIFGLGPRSASAGGMKVRCVRYDDEGGVPQGFAAYKVTENESDFTAHTVDVSHLTAATDDAYSALWRYLLELDLVARVNAPVRSVSEPLVWQLGDYRSAQKTAESDHLWLRIVDVPAALEARRFSAPGAVVLDVDDELGFAHGSFELVVHDDGSATVTPATATSVGAGADGIRQNAPARVSLSIRELSSLYLGGVRALDLARAGRIREHSDGAAAAVDRAFRSPVAPWSSIWF